MSLWRLWKQTKQYKISFTHKFKKAHKKLNQTNKELVKAIITQLANGEPLAAKHHDHALQGEWLGHRECHIKPDLLLIYKIDKNLLILTCVNIGSHSDVFK